MGRLYQNWTRFGSIALTEYNDDLKYEEDLNYKLSNYIQNFATTGSWGNPHISQISQEDILASVLPLHAQVGLRPSIRSVYCIADAALVLSGGCRSTQQCRAQSIVILCQARIKDWFTTHNLPKFGLKLLSEVIYFNFFFFYLVITRQLHPLVYMVRGSSMIALTCYDIHEDLTTSPSPYQCQ